MALTAQRCATRFTLVMPAPATRALRKARLALTELRYEAEGFGMTSPIPREDAYLVALQVSPCANHELWNDAGLFR